MELVAITAHAEESLPQILEELYTQMKKQGFPLGDSQITIRTIPQAGPLTKIRLENPGHFNLEIYSNIDSLIRVIREDGEDIFYILDIDVIEAFTETLPFSIRLAHALKKYGHTVLASGLCRIYWENWQQAYQETYEEIAPRLLCREELHPTFLKEDTIDAVLEHILYQKVISATSCTTIPTEQECMLYTVRITDSLYADVMWVQQNEDKPLCYIMQNADGELLYDKTGKGFYPRNIQMGSQELEDKVVEIIKQYREKDKGSTSR